jgi:polar amino acid transport system substrate-binding protein
VLRLLLSLAIVAVAGCASAPPPAPPAAVADLAPSGTLRAAINFGNPILATRGASGADPRGVSVDLSRELAARLGVPVTFVTYTAAGKVVEGLRQGAWDIGFVAIDPARGAEMEQSPPYVIIEGAYLVPAGSPIQRNEDVDRDGVRVVVGAASAYDLYLSRELKHAKLVRAPTSPAVSDMLVAERLDVAAGVKQQLQADAQRIANVRLLDGRFMLIQQAMATPKSRDAGTRYVREFVEEMKRSGFVARALQRHGIEGAAVAPAAAR